MSFVGFIKAEDVHDAKTFAGYVQQVCGTPYCNQRDMAALMKCIKDFKERYPHLAENPWPTLVRCAQWVRSKRKRPAHVYTVVRTMLTWAWEDGALPELDPSRYVETDVEEAIGQALIVERDPVWRDRLINAEGVEVRKEVLAAWTRRSSSSPAA